MLSRTLRQTSLAALLAAVLLTACWNNVGRPLNRSPQVMLEDAEKFCDRGDWRGCQSLLRALLEEAPESPEADVARRRLKTLEHHNPTFLHPPKKNQKF